LQNCFPKNTFSYSSGYLESIRISKWEEEKQKIKKAITIIDEVFRHIECLNASDAILGISELGLRQIIIEKIFEFGGEGESFESIVAFGANSAVPHHHSGNTIIRQGVLLIDMGAQYQWYCSDFTRTIWVGEKNLEYEKFKNAHDLVKQSHEAAYNGYNSWMTGGDLDTLSRDIVQNSQYKDLFIHNLGHGLWLDIHENPRLKPGDETLLQENMVFTIEPWIYLEGEFGIRLEDIVFLENKKLVKYTQINL
jgi:Xaa-Pro aminopeptidase/Xaa-Pro dipeptidase